MAFRAAGAALEANVRLFRGPLVVVVHQRSVRLVGHFSEELFEIPIAREMTTSDAIVGLHGVLIARIEEDADITELYLQTSEHAAFRA